jgi:hypothetical protein
MVRSLMARLSAVKGSLAHRAMRLIVNAQIRVYVSMGNVHAWLDIRVSTANLKNVKITAIRMANVLMENAYVIRDGMVRTV